MITATIQSAVGPHGQAGLTLVLESVASDKYGDLRELATTHALILRLGAAYVEEHGPLDNVQFKSDGRRAWITVPDRGAETFRGLVTGELGQRFYDAGILGEMLDAGSA